MNTNNENSEAPATGADCIERNVMPKYTSREGGVYLTDTRKLVCSVWPEYKVCEDRLEGESWLSMRRRTDPDRAKLELEVAYRAENIAAFLSA